MVKMVLGSSDTQGQTMASVGEARIASYDQAISALSAFDNAGDLQGAAYDSGKQYGMNVITPLLKGAIMYSELVSEAVPGLSSKYRSEVGDDDLDSEVLESEIRSLESSLHSIRGMYNAMVGDESTSASTLSSLSNRMDDLLKQRNEKIDKLRKLNMFAGSSNDVFSVGEGSSLVDNLAQNLQTGLSQIQTEFASFSGTFPKHSVHTLGWAQNIEGEWENKVKIDGDYKNVLKKIEDGKGLTEKDMEVIQSYKKRHPSKELPDTLVNAIEQYIYEKTLAEALGDDGVKYNTMNLYDAITAISDNDWFKRGAQVLGLTPKNLTEAFLQSDGVIGLLGSVDKGTKGRKFVSGVMSTMAWYESLGNKGGTLKKIFDGISDIASPVETIVKKGLEGARDAGMAKFGKYIKGGEEVTGLLGKGLKYFPKVAKVLGKVGTVMTFADLGITAISSGVDEYSKTKDIGRAAGKGALSAIASVGPLEGATIGGAIGGLPGAAVGAVVGGVIQGIKAWKPKFFDDPVKGTKEIIDDVGNGIKGTVKNISNFMGGIGKALGVG
ncbi:Ribonuclease [Streptococcus mitis]|uniref:Ribonuclease n=2 Tax=Streptococcus TaxID=1301 RepID=A0A3R9LCP8_STRMT|nr:MULTISPECIES: hypothetical protein [Streptococcus]RSI83104.1 Ribonuclease [Streptococcus mitis]RSJ08917.1 Ribonuclease [Streptococcus mitis]RSJ61696.1 Ribonuclease [Streptococcus oralis]